MTSEPSDTPTSTPAGPVERDARQFTEPLRQPAAFALLTVNGLILLFAVGDLFVIFEDWASSLLERAGGSFTDFVGLVSIGFPLLAVLLATHVRPRLPQARLITVLALVEYGVSAVFGALCLLVDFLYGVTGSHTTIGMSAARRALEDLLIRAGEYTLLAIAGLAVFHLFQGLYPPVRPEPAAPAFGGGYGYPAGFGQPSTPGQPGDPSSFHPYGHQAHGGQQHPWVAQPGYPPPVAPPQQESGPQRESAPPRAPAEPAPEAGEDAQPTQAVRPPRPPDGPTEEWRP
ncbi:hypothetical protein ACNTMW_09620 [Planosporangium sp. 12N6]|uniref:hypothetical protein n=1 Tax=Planosporangium spinosum TaxID=3402278 RepID=UPI003CF3573E